MKKILLLSDTHGYIDESILRHVSEADEVWHAGDIGNISVADQISRLKPLKAVYGNIDDDKVRITFPEHQYFNCEGLKVLMIHIAGNPGKYNPQVKNLLGKFPADVLICGHSHLLKVVRDGANHLHINPGAAGIHGFHKVRTLIRFKIDSGKMKELDVIELGERSKSA
ncbi:MAG: metallophosphoesterase family protein [Bacteroidetes bacterium]|jgi:putative phosphoesterase|nr:metallophosphoesterase family protein [Bacteroidota bacterium]MBK9320300.1 metallophosphoesterase family protein [Bacteroidota bacterium]